LIGGFGAMDLSKDLGNSLVALPFTLVLDRQGKVAYTHLGPVKPDKFRSVITKLL
jgi:peroxiredoxin